MNATQFAPICPSCGEPVTFSFSHLKTKEKVKLVLVVLLLGYVVLSIFLLAASTPPGQGKGCYRYNPQQLPERCRDNPLYSWVQPLTKEPAFQIFVGGGLISGVLIFYVDWLQSLYENWQKKRDNGEQKPEKVYKHECRHCGMQWN